MKKQLEDIRKEYFNNSKKVKVLEIGSASGEYSEILSYIQKVISTEKGSEYKKILKRIHCVNTHPDEPDFEKN